MKYINITLTSAGATINNTIGNGNALNLNIISASPITLAGNVVINPTVIAGRATSFKVRWGAITTISTFSVVICGQTISQDLVNQTGVFDCYYDGANWTVYAYPDFTEKPQEFEGVETVTVPSGGGTLTLVAGESKQVQRLVGAPTTLTSNYTATASTTGVKDGTEFEVVIGGQITLGANSLTVFGLSISANDALNGGVSVRAVFDAASSVWRAIYINRPVTLPNISAIAPFTIVGNATNASASPTAIPFAADGDVFVRDGSVLVAKKLEAKNFGTGLSAIKTRKVSISSAEWLTGFSSPIEIIDSAGAGLTEIILSVIADCSFISTPYATNTNVRIYQAGAASNIGQQNGLLGFTASGLQVIPVPTVSGSPTQQYIKNAKTFLQVLSGNPTAGDGSITLIITYFTIS